jgi:glutamate racemase
MRVCVFDSGVGGVGVAQELRRLMPGARLTYLMDDAGFPYGGKTDAALLARVLEVVGAGLAAVRPDLMVIACNTASTVALAALRARYAVAFVGCVPPVRWAAQVSVSRTIGVLATPATVRGPYLRDLAARFAPDCRMLVHGAATLARLAEDRFAGRTLDMAALLQEIAGLTGQPGGAAIDAVALGCTHYAWLLPELRAAMPPQTMWLDPAPPVARQVLRVAEQLGGVADETGDDGLVLHTAAGDVDVGNPGWSAAGFTRSVALEVVPAV